jgi:hypothetical protein
MAAVAAIDTQALGLGGVYRPLFPCPEYDHLMELDLIYDPTPEKTETL